ncbi:hypothetical protein SGLAM104S_04095 [Streptomyces glaucescens]
MRLVPQVSSRADPTLGADADELFASAEAAGLGPRAQADTVLAVRRAADIWPPLARLLPVPSTLELTAREVQDLLGDTTGRLAAHDIEVLWPENAARSLTTRVVVGGERRPPADMRSFFGGDGTVDVRWQLDLDGAALTEQETAEIAAAEQPLALLRGNWVLIGSDIARKARERDLKPLNPIEALAVALTGYTEIGGKQVRVAPSTWLLALRRRLTEPDDGTETAEQPAALAATLRDYQLRGLRWMHRLTSLGLGGCLADDMGLGKTIQLISLHLLRQEHPDSAGPTLVVCPASLLGNWQREVGRFAPGTPVRRYHGPGRTLAGADSGFVLTTYGTMRLDAERLGAHRWSMVVADEAQHVKNPHSSTAKALRLIPADARIALTGTPVENNLSELWAVLDWTTPGLLGSHGHFRSRWIAAIEAEHKERAEFGPPPGEEGEYGSTAQRLAELVRPFLLRRKKSDPGIAPELPPKTETDRPVPLTPEQRTLYETHVREIMAQIKATEGIARSGLVLELLTGLKQICNHPAQFLKETDGTRLARPFRQAGTPRRTAGHHRLRGRSRPGLHPVRHHGAAAGGPPARARRPHAAAPRRHPGATPRGDGPPVPGRGGARLPALPQGRRHRTQPHPRRPRRALRPLVEPGGRGPGHRPRLPHRPDPHRPGASDDRRGHRRGPHRRPARSEEEPGGRRTGLRGAGTDRTDQRRAGQPGRAEERGMSGDETGARGFPAFAARRGSRARGQSWWGKAWADALEDTSLEEDALKKGRAYARTRQARTDHGQPRTHLHHRLRRRHPLQDGAHPGATRRGRLGVALGEDRRTAGCGRGTPRR